MQKTSFRMPRCSILAVLAVSACNVASADHGVWGAYQTIFGHDSYWESGVYHLYSLTVHDYDEQWSESPWSSTLSAVARRYTPSTGYEYLYFCAFEDPMEARVSRIPDFSGFMGPNKKFTYTIVAPACYGPTGISFPETTITVQCDVGEFLHSSSNGAEKHTNADGSKHFYSTQTESVFSHYDMNVSGYTCSIRFTSAQGTGGSEFARLQSYEQRRKLK
jgi:hypothetical protein